MADNILKAVSLRRDLVEGGKHAVQLNATIRKYVHASLFGRQSSKVIAKLQRELIRDMAHTYFPIAQAVGKSSARPILLALGGEALVEKGGRLTGQAKRAAQILSRRNLNHFKLGVGQATGFLKGDIRAAFSQALLQGRRGRESRKALVDDILKADKAELLSLRRGRIKVRAAAKEVRQAEALAAKTGNYGPVKKSHAALEKVKGNVKHRAAFLARLETAVQARARDVIRREASDAQKAAFTAAGYGYPRVWVTVNAGEACPSCQALHGTEIKNRGEGPGNADTFCGTSCMCQAVPKEYTKGRPVAKPLRLDEGPSEKVVPAEDVAEVRPKVPPRPRAKPKSKPAKPKAPPMAQASEFTPAKTIPEAEDWAAKNLMNDAGLRELGMTDEAAIAKALRKDVNYSGVPVKVANSFNRQFSAMQQKYGLRKLEAIQSKTIGKDAVAEFVMSEGKFPELHINADFVKHLKDTGRSLGDWVKSSAKDGFTVANTVDDFAYHEASHYFHRLKGTGSVNLQDLFIDAHDGTIEALGRYAGRSASEFFAEAATKSRIGGVRSFATRRTADRLREILP